jgi:hypothetical protein
MRQGKGMELPVAELLRCARPLPAHDDMVIEDLTTEEGDALLIHAVDVVPTIYELLGIEPPKTINGYLQHPIEGESFANALTDATVPGKRTQFYTMLGQRSIYHDGWLANTVHPPLSGWAASTRTSGSCITLKPTGRRRRTSRRIIPNASSH